MSEESLDSTSSGTSADSSSSSQDASTVQTASAESDAPKQSSELSQTALAAQQKETMESAYKRVVEKGENPHEVRKSIQGLPDKPAKPTRSSDPEGTDKPVEKDRPANLGLNPKELNALKRAKFDMSAAAMIPTANLKAYARSVMASQSEIDREFTRSRQQAGTEAVTDADDANAVDPDPAQIEQPSAQQQKAQSPPPLRQAASPPTAPSAGGTLAPYQLTQQDYDNLVNTGGEQFAQDYVRHMGELSQHHLMQTQQLRQVYDQQLSEMRGHLTYLAGEFLNREFDSALSALQSNPIYKDLKLTPEQKQELRNEAEGLIRNSRKKDYRFNQAVATAAAALFPRDLHQEASKALLSQRADSLNGTLGRPNQQRPGAAPMSEQDRMREAYRQIKAGADPRRAREVAYAE